MIVQCEFEREIFLLLQRIFLRFSYSKQIYGIEWIPRCCCCCCCWSSLLDDPSLNQFIFHLFRRKYFRREEWDGDRKRFICWWVWDEQWSAATTSSKVQLLQPKHIFTKFFFVVWREKSENSVQPFPPRIPKLCEELASAISLRPMINHSTVDFALSLRFHLVRFLSAPWRRSDLFRNHERIRNVNEPSWRIFFLMWKKHFSSVCSKISIVLEFMPLQRKRNPMEIVNG